MTDKSSRFTNIHIPRDNANAAIAALEAGRSFGILTGDHVAGETCISAMARLQRSNNARLADPALADTARTAVFRLKAGKGWGLVDTDHSGGNTCVQVVVTKTTA